MTDDTPPVLYISADTSDLTTRYNATPRLHMGADAWVRMPEWQPIETAPDHERCLVAGWHPRHGRTAGYWWWHEDTIWRGKGCEHPEATLWCPIIIAPFPASDEGEQEDGDGG